MEEISINICGEIKNLSSPNLTRHSRTKSLGYLASPGKIETKGFDFDASILKYKTAKRKQANESMDYIGQNIKQNQMKDPSYQKVVQARSTQLGPVIKDYINLVSQNELMWDKSKKLVLLNQFVGQQISNPKFRLKTISQTSASSPVKPQASKSDIDKHGQVLGNATSMSILYKKDSSDPLIEKPP